MAEISLNASMRSNLLSLQQTQRLQDTTQMRLSSGLKVNSAIDNPSSYYTASSLNNRAEDLGALLDAMTQGIQTIKAANEVLETGTAILQQANAVVSKAMEFAPTELSKDWFIKEAAKQNGVVVSNAVELQQAIDDNKELIVVYGKINLTDTSLNLKNSQKLVGTEYFSNIDKNALYRGENNSRKSELVFNNSGEEQHAIIPENNTLLSDLSIKYTNMNENGAHSVIYLDGNNAAASKKATINNLDIELKVSETAVSTHPAIHTLNNGEAVINGRINIQTAGKRGHGIYAQNNSTATILSEASVNIKTSGAYSYGTHSFANSVINVNSGAQLNILTTGSNGYAIYAANRSNINIASFAKVNVKTTGTIRL